jgi:hypothetical protein
LVAALISQKKVRIIQKWVRKYPFSSFFDPGVKHQSDSKHTENYAWLSKEHIPERPRRNEQEPQRGFSSGSIAVIAGPNLKVCEKEFKK